MKNPTAWSFIHTVKKCDGQYIMFFFILNLELAVPFLFLDLFLYFFFSYFLSFFHSSFPFLLSYVDQVVYCLLLLNVIASLE